MNAGLLLATVHALTQAPDSDLVRIAARLPGTYDTFAQAAADSAAGAAYRHVRAVLRIAPVVVHGADGPAFYLEQALAGEPPYRQRVIVFAVRDGVVENALYRLREPATFVGFDGQRTLRRDELDREMGCDARWFARPDGSYAGNAGTTTHCASTLRGATHVVSAFVLTDSTFTTLDQGLDDAGAVRWGPPVGVEGHRFVRRP